MTATLAASIVATLAYLMHRPEAEWLVMRATARTTQPWRLLTSALVHGDPLHLLFNGYWTWTLGTRVEEALGSMRTLLLFVFLAAGASAAEYAFARGGIGLSGVGYGLVAYLWMAGRHDPRLRVVDGRIVKLFAIWGAICIVTTALGVFPVGNVAHATGAVLGTLLGARRRAAATMLCAAAIVMMVWLRPYVNLERGSAADEINAGYDAFYAGRYEEALHWDEDGVTIDPDDAIGWHDLGCAYDQLHMRAEAHDAFAHAHALDPHKYPDG